MQKASRTIDGPWARWAVLVTLTLATVDRAHAQLDQEEAVQEPHPCQLQVKEAAVGSAHPQDPVSLGAWPGPQGTPMNDRVTPLRWGR